MILHLGIFIQFPIPWFALVVCSVYLLQVPVSFWKKIFTTNNSKKTLAFYYDSECPLCVRTKITITHLDWFNKVEFKTVQLDAVENPNLKDIQQNDLLNDIYSVDLKGKVYSGVDTYIQVFKRIFYLYPIGLILQLPGFYHIAKSIYGYVATNRTTERCTEENCGYNPPIIPDDDKIKILNNLTIKDLKFKFFSYLLVICSLFQFGILYKSWLVRDIISKTQYEKSSINQSINTFIDHYCKITRISMGITGHPVFSNEIHFDNYNHIVAIVYKSKEGKETWLPIIDKNGQPDLYIYGQNWVNWTFRVNGMKINNIELRNGIERYTAFWAFKKGISLNDATILIKVKKIESPKGWEKDFLNKQIAKPWMDAGIVEWKNDNLYSKIKDIENL
jgi:predicted DCC family thiol-disulfide oxidoreductase YuxK